MLLIKKLLILIFKRKINTRKKKQEEEKKKVGMFCIASAGLRFKLCFLKIYLFLFKI